MKPMTLNMSKVKKIAGDKKTSTFAHDDGHTIVILHSALPALQRKQIEKMPLCEGGKVEKLANGGEAKPTGVQGSSPAPHPEQYEQTLSNGWNNIKSAFTGQAKANGGEIKADDKPDLSPPKTSMTVPQSARDDYARDVADAHTYMKPADEDATTIQRGQYKMYADPQEPVSANDSAPVMQAPAPVQASPEPATQLAETPVNPQVPETPATTNIMNPNGTTNAPQAVKLQQQAAREQQAVDQAKGQSTAIIEDAYAKQRAAIAQRDQDNLNDLKKHKEEFKQYITEHPINPKSYVENMGTAAKVGNAMALFLGGIGSGLVGGSNPAMDYLNNQINRDLDAQKARGDQQRTILGAYEQLYGESTTANNLAKISLNDVYTHKMQSMAAKLGTPQAKAAADAFSANKAIENQQLLLNSINDAGATRTGGTHINGSSPSQTLPSKVSNKPASLSASHQGMAADDPNWKDDKLQVGSSTAPKTNPPKQIKINYDQFKRSQQLGAKGVPGEIAPSEVTEANNAINYVNQMNQVMREIHKQFPEMWKHGYNATPLTTGLDDAHVGGITIPNPGSAFPGMKEYFTASAAIKKQLSNLIKNGLTPEVSELIQRQLVNTNDTPSQYRSKLETIDGLLMQSVPVSVLKKYHLADDLPE